MASRIEDYAMIGDLGTAALVGRDGSIDWLCLPRFDSDACLAALLGEPENGRWQIVPHHFDQATRVTRRYRPDTLILETRFENSEGAATLIDFMPPRKRNAHLIRIVVGERGCLTFNMEFILRFGYGTVIPWVTRLGDSGIRAIAGSEMLVLRTPVKMHGENFKTLATFTVGARDRVPFVLSFGLSYESVPKYPDVERNLQDTEQFWTSWAGKNKINAPWREAVTRSLITLKALTFAPTGGIVAAPTTSLPECIGGRRNWDYRFCWLRDATMTLLSLMNAGYYEEAHMWRDWLLRAAAGNPAQVQIMYGVCGERRLTEWEVPWLPGYESSQPVRIGNAAHNQYQLDIFGEVMDALHQAREGGLGFNKSAWGLQRELLFHLEKVWADPDHGIWEVRSGPEHFTYSKAMAWLAFDRGIRSAEAFNLSGPVDDWRRVRNSIHSDVCERGFDPALGSFVRAYGSKELDASLLHLPAIGFLPPEDPRIIGTVEAIERRLTVDGLVKRYDTAVSEDGLKSEEGIFLACSFWLADAYFMIGRSDEAFRLFKRLLSVANDVGLMSEEYSPESGRLVGNFPQALSHLALVNTASNLAHHCKPLEQRSDVRITREKAGEPA
jgi:GH15 family glucan-1,4-alpha-glucosidase